MSSLRLLIIRNVLIAQRNSAAPACYFHSSSLNFENTPKKANNDGKNRFGKSFKTIEFKEKIEDHDLKSKANHMKKWLAKGHTIRSIIYCQHQENSRTEQIYNTLVKELGADGKFECKKSGKDIKFIIDPLAPPARESNKVAEKEK